MSTTDPITPADLAGCLAITTSVLEGWDGFDILELARFGPGQPARMEWWQLSSGEQDVIKIAAALRTVETLTGSIDRTWQARVAMVLDDLSSAMRSDR